jgi:hypothetical protein
LINDPAVLLADGPTGAVNTATGEEIGGLLLDGRIASDLAGIYFAVQANYEQQFVSANQQALNAGVRQYKAAFARTLKTLPALLKTASATPSLPGPGRAGQHGRTAKPTPGHS